MKISTAFLIPCVLLLLEPVRKGGAGWPRRAGPALPTRGGGAVGPHDGPRGPADPRKGLSCPILRVALLCSPSPDRRDRFSQAARGSSCSLRRCSSTILAKL